MVGIVQLAEHRIVVPGVVGSSPITHPIKTESSLPTLCFYMVFGGEWDSHTGCVTQNRVVITTKFVYNSGELMLD